MDNDLIGNGVERESMARSREARRHAGTLIVAMEPMSDAISRQRLLVLVRKTPERK